MAGYRNGFVNKAIAVNESDIEVENRKLISEAIVLENYDKLSRAIGNVQIIGTDCTDDTSTTILCKLVTPTDHLEIGDVVVIGEGGANLRVWYVQVAIADKLSFSDANLINGSAGINNYDAIKNDLMIWIISKAKLYNFITKNQIFLSRAIQGVNDETIPSKTIILTATSSIKEVLEYLYSLCGGVNQFLNGIILRPTADGLTGMDIYPDTGEDHYEDVDEEASDGDGTYLFHRAENLDFALYCLYGGSVFPYIVGSVIAAGSSDYIVRSQVLTRNPYNNKPWTKTMIADAEFGVGVFAADPLTEEFDSFVFDNSDVPDGIGIAGIVIYAEVKYYFDVGTGYYYYRITKHWTDVLINNAALAIAVAQDSVVIGTQPKINFKSADGSVNITITEDADNEKVDIDLSSGNIITQPCPIYNPNGLVNAVSFPIWRAPFSCIVTNVRGLRIGGTGATINARKNGTDTHLASALSLTSENTLMDGGAPQNVQYDTGDLMEAMLVSTSGKPPYILIQIDLIRGGKKKNDILS
jgi:hypothetical protein